MIQSSSQYTKQWLKRYFAIVMNRGIVSVYIHGDLIRVKMVFSQEKRAGRVSCKINECRLVLLHFWQNNRFVKTACGSYSTLFTFGISCYTYIATMKNEPMMGLVYQLFRNICHQFFFYSQWRIC